MKSKTKKSLFLGAAVMLACTGALGAREMKIEVTNDSEYGIKLDIGGYAGALEGSEPIELSIEAGGSIQVAYDNCFFPSTMDISPIPIEGRGLEFVYFYYSAGGGRIQEGENLVKIGVLEGPELIGLFKVVATLSSEILEIRISENRCKL